MVTTGGRGAVWSAMIT
ncbi:hypothetical protein A2U01_0059273, partial [Trifolium medium]|nr:hypothetical protein [Trifolium medium]